MDAIAVPYSIEEVARDEVRTLVNVLSLDESAKTKIKVFSKEVVRQILFSVKVISVVFFFAKIGEMIQ